MTSTVQVPSRSEIERAVWFCIRAPSVHNTQPWHWTYEHGVLELHADRSRQLPALDPDGRSLLLSCGAALELARLGLGACGWRTAADRMATPEQPDLLARIRPLGREPIGPLVLRRAEAAERRYTERRPFFPTPVADRLVDAVVAAARDEGTYGYAVRRADERLDLAVVFTWADAVESGDPAYRAELAHWTRHGGEGATDGVAAEAVPHAGARRHTEVPIRDFEAGITGGQELVDIIDEQPVYLILFTTGDHREARLRAGEAYARVTIEAQRLGLASSAITQAVDLPGVRERFRVLMGWTDHPQMVLRIGYPPAGKPPAQTNRRPLSDVLTVRD